MAGSVMDWDGADVLVLVLVLLLDHVRVPGVLFDLVEVVLAGYWLPRARAWARAVYHFFSRLFLREGCCVDCGRNWTKKTLHYHLPHQHRRRQRRPLSLWVSEGPQDLDSNGWRRHCPLRPGRLWRGTEGCSITVPCRWRPIAQGRRPWFPLSRISWRMLGDTMARGDPRLEAEDPTPAGFTGVEGCEGRRDPSSSAMLVVSKSKSSH